MSTAPRPVPPLREIYLYLTGNCNLRCRHCWIDPTDERVRSTRHLPWSTLRPIIEEARTLGLHFAKLTGGEPFLHPDVCEILHDLHAMNLGIRIESNGTLIREREAKAIKEAGAFISISLDGPNPELHDDLRAVKGSFQQTLRGAAALREQGVRFQVIFSIYRGNADHLKEMPEFVRSIGASSLKVNVITLMGRSPEMQAKGELLTLPEIIAIKSATRFHQDGLPVYFDLPPALLGLDEINKNGLATCGIINILGVLHNGHAGLCGIGEHIEAMDFGDLQKVSIRKVWEEHPTLQTLRENVPYGLRGICGRCVFRNVCLGKCVAATYHAKGMLYEGFATCEEAFRLGLFPARALVEHRNVVGKADEPKA